MREKFYEYHQQEKLPQLLQEALIVLDTNSLLNIYRYDSESREKYFEILDVVKDRLFLTYQVANEFYKNRLHILLYKINFKDELISEINKYYLQLQNLVEQPDNIKNESVKLLKYEKKLKEGLKELIEKQKNDVVQCINEYSIEFEKNFIQSDPILPRIEGLFEGKIHDNLANDKIHEIQKDGKERYANKIPPGYMDSKKPEPECYGDLIIWNELIELAKEKRKGILFISDDTKEDWYDLLNNKQYKLGPRKELIREFREKTSNDFYAITTLRFIEMISEAYHIGETKNLIRDTKMIAEDMSNKQDEDNVVANTLKQDENIILEFYCANDTLICALTGAIDHHTCVAIRRAVDRNYQKKGAKNLVFDFKKVTFMDSSGIGMLMGRHRLVEIYGGQVAIVGASEEITKILRMSNVFKLMKEYKSLSQVSFDDFN